MARPGSRVRLLETPGNRRPREMIAAPLARGTEPGLQAFSGARYISVVIRNPHVDPRVVRQRGSVLPRAFGDGVDELAAEPENARCAREGLPARGPQKGRLEIRGDPRVAGAAARGDGEPDCHVGGGHEDRPTDGTARALELITERHFDRALAGPDLAQAKSVVRVERRIGQPAFQLGPIGPDWHQSATASDRRVGRVLFSTDERERQGEKALVLMTMFIQNVTK